MATILSTKTSGVGGLSVTGDASGILQLASADGTTAVTIDASQNVTFAGSVNTPNTFGFKNRIINGNMAIDQRNAGAASANTLSGYFLDRWFVGQSPVGKIIAQQNQGSITPPVGFSNYLGVTSQSAYSVATGDVFTIYQSIEGFNTADLGFGTANASTVTISFQVYSSLTGTFGGALKSSTVPYRSYLFTYSIPVANTWTTISITIAGDTTGTWIGATNGVGMFVLFGLGCGSTFTSTAGSWQTGNYTQPTGSVSVVGTSGATFYITGVQLEKGSTATSFDYRPYGTELALCQRYYQIGDIHLLAANTNGGDGTVSFPVQMRTSPTYTFSDSSGNASKYTDSAGGNLTLAVNANNVNSYRFRAQTALARAAAWWEFNYTLSAEL
jgi:hypothetical protein